VFIIRNKYTTIEKVNNYGEFGAFINTEPTDRLGFYGNCQSFLFRFNPDFRIFNTYNAKGGENYFYLNSKKMKNSSYPTGIGFGGDDYESFRIWLDVELSVKSKSSDFDKTFENGPVTDSASKYLNIETIEVWGFPDDLTEKRQAEFRMQEQNELMSNRKIDKKEFMSNEFSGVFMEKQFAFKENMKIDLDFEKKNLKGI
jgi:hypothetical protein